MNSSKKWMNEFVFTIMRRVFLRFLKEIEDTKKYFEIIWPLTSQNNFFQSCSWLQCDYLRFLLNERAENEPKLAISTLLHSTESFLQDQIRTTFFAKIYNILCFVYSVKKLTFVFESPWYASDRWSALAGSSRSRSHQDSDWHCEILVKTGPLANDNLIAP